LENYNELLKKAKEMTEKAYAPYSNIHVGCALLSKNGKIYLGVNVENSSYGLTICAERNAIGAAVSAGDRDIIAAAVVSKEIEPIMPCGACRQVLSEFNPEMLIISMDKNGNTVMNSLLDLFPAGFSLHHGD